MSVFQKHVKAIERKSRQGTEDRLKSRCAGIERTPRPGGMGVVTL